MARILPVNFQKHRLALYRDNWRKDKDLQFELAYHPGNIIKTALARKPHGARFVPDPETAEAYQNTYPEKYDRSLYLSRKRSAARTAGKYNSEFSALYPPSAKRTRPESLGGGEDSSGDDGSEVQSPARRPPVYAPHSLQGPAAYVAARSPDILTSGLLPHKGASATWNPTTGAVYNGTSANGAAYRSSPNGKASLRLNERIPPVGPHPPVPPSPQRHLARAQPSALPPPARLPQQGTPPQGLHPMAIPPPVPSVLPNGNQLIPSSTDPQAHLRKDPAFIIATAAPDPAATGTLIYTNPDGTPIHVTYTSEVGASDVEAEAAQGLRILAAGAAGQGLVLRPGPPSALMSSHLVGEAEREFLPRRLGGELLRPQYPIRRLVGQQRVFVEAGGGQKLIRVSRPEPEFVDMNQEFVAAGINDTVYLKRSPRAPRKQTFEGGQGGEGSMEDMKPPEPQEPWHKREANKVWELVFSYMDAKTLMVSAMRVSRSWSAIVEGMERLWEAVELGGKRLTKVELAAVGRRRPRRLGLSWTGVGREEVEAGLTGNDRLRTLSLAGCNWEAAKALRVLPATMALEELDLRWVQGASDEVFSKLATEWTGFRLTESLFLSACDLGDPSVRLIANQFSRLRRLDLSYCTKVSDVSMEVLGAAGSVVRASLSSLNLASCPLITAEIFATLLKLGALGCVDVRSTKIPEARCEEFREACRALGRIVSVLF